MSEFLGLNFFLDNNKYGFIFVVEYWEIKIIYFGKCFDYIKYVLVMVKLRMLKVYVKYC